MHAHLLPLDAAPLPDAVATCRLDGGDGNGWLLALTESIDAPYEVEDLLGHPQGAGTSAAVTEFHGPRDADQVAADRRAGRERVWPAAAQVEGALGFVSLRARDGANVVIGFADTHETLDAVSRAIMSTPLLPGEDPARLRGPDRYTACAVEDGGVTALLRSSAATATS